MRVNKFDTTVSVVCCALLAFFGWHATKGPRGFSYTERLEERTAQLQQQRDTVEQQRKQVDMRVTHLRPESIDPDLLDEEVRKTLYFANAKEIVVLQQR